ncbi:kinase-like domain-containing protein [Rhizophagus clarus]|uniref:Kinase-like domain-containing protein n=1 Tax=Rhizophagus clarus TaxID=94130 RepID=A0A8H3L9P9_9GLOM|nr:kinase-like domain-containing protein [Rhizophagus clarus]
MELQRNVKLESSPIKVEFIPVDQSEDYCFRCGELYTETLLFEQKYCETCLLRYVNKITNDNCTYLDLHISTKGFIQCNEHETRRNEDFYTRNIKDWCEHCSVVSYFKQIPSNSLAYCDSNLNFEKKNEIIESERDCKLCRKTVYPTSSLHDLKLKMCSDCYQISYETIESSSTKETILILHLPWWDSFHVCVVCEVRLVFEYINQKWCPHCFIFYSGCRYCLTTNVIFGHIKQSQCKKCKRTIQSIMKTNINIGTNDIDNFLYNTRNIINNFNTVDYIKEIDRYSDTPSNVYKYLKEKMYKMFKPEAVMEWIPYSRIKNLKEIAKGGFSSIYQATWLDGGINGSEYSSCYRMENEIIVIKKFSNSQHINKSILNEVKSCHKCYEFERVIRCYGITKNPEEKNEYMLVMNFADGGNLHNFLRKNFAKITWREKIDILWQISCGLETIHNANFIHRDFHSGNILLVKSYRKWKTGQWIIGDLGLSQPVQSVNNVSSNDTIYGVMAYLAPEILKSYRFSESTTSSDIYSLSMIMWEITTGRKPFSNITHDHQLAYKIIDGERPKITDDTPKCLAKLMKRCWDSDPTKRPSITEIRETLSLWYNEKESVEFDEAEKARNKLIESRKFDPNSAEISHSNTIVVIGISKSSSSKSTSTDSFEYITKEYKFDINNIQSTTVQDFMNIQHPATIEKEVGNDFTKHSRKRDIELNTETQYRKHVKIGDAELKD